MPLAIVPSIHGIDRPALLASVLRADGTFWLSGDDLTGIKEFDRVDIRAAYSIVGSCIAMMSGGGDARPV
jgi:hypothetical protein